MEVDNCERENWSGKRDSNPRPSAWKADALATELFPPNYSKNKKMVEGGGFEPPKASPTDLQSVPFDRSGTPPREPSLARSRAGAARYTRDQRPPAIRRNASWRRDSNPQPPHYK